MICSIIFAFLYAVSQAYFFDVGQGHSTLFVQPGTLVLVDCGSTRNPTDIVKYEEDKEGKEAIRNIQSKIKLHLGYNKMLILITHGDVDHYGWIHKVFQDKSLSDKLNQMLFVCGGFRKHYEQKGKGFLSFIDEKQIVLKFTHDPNPVFVGDEALNVAAINEHIDRFFGSSSIVKILSAVINAKEEDKNVYSIVANIKLGDYSFIVTGDAPSKVTDTISDGVNADVLLASHHGSSAEGANSRRWFEKVNPKYLVIGHGDRYDYCHPDPETIARASKLDSIKNTILRPHMLYHGNINKSAITAFDKLEQIGDMSSMDRAYLYTVAQSTQQIKEGDNRGVYVVSDYYFSITNIGILSTLTQGNIEFAVSPIVVGGSSNMSITWDKEKFDPAKFNGSNDIEKLLSWYFRRDTTTPSIANYISRIFCKGKLLGRYILTLNIKQTEMPHLSYVDVSDSALDCDAEKDHIISLINSNPQIEKLNIDGHKFSTTQVEDMERAWNNRGFSRVRSLA